jgi:serine/threonine-protein kinase
LVRPLGEGGMGTVWVAHNVVLDVNVAIKLINMSEGNSGRSSERLLQEARAAARLGHPAIVRVFDFGRTRRGDPFVVMELIRGVPLSDHADHEHRLPAIRAVQLMLPIADALSAAHSKGIVHRDVKPENVILSTDEAGRIQPKLLDFGIASMVEIDRKLTLEGTVLGTPDYMSPEQARGAQDLDHRSDVWSFSVMLYELLTGKLPFGGRNYNALLWSIIHDAPMPTTERAAGDKQLWRVIERGLRKQPNDRWESMRVMGEALALWLYERGVREDVCAASLKTSWLDAGLAGVRIEVPSVSPGPPSNAEEKHTLPHLSVAPEAAPPEERPSGIFSLTAITPSTPAEPQLPPSPEIVTVRPHPRRATLVVGGALLASALAALGAIALLRPTPVAPAERATSQVVSKPAPRERSEKPKRGVAPAASTAAPAVPSSAAEAATATEPAPAPSAAKTPGTRTQSRSKPVRTSPKPARGSPPEAAPAPAKPGTSEYDFGF